MSSYLSIASKYLSVHKRKTRLIVFSVIMAVVLVVGIFSMLDALVKFERVQVIKSEGNYHILIRNPSQNEIRSIASCIDVKSSGLVKDLGNGEINDKQCAFVNVDANIAPNMNISLITGSAPEKANEIVLEKWYMDKCILKIGDTVTVQAPNGTIGKYVISGVIHDWGATKAAAIPFVFLSPKVSGGFTSVSSQFFILFKDGVNTQTATKQISSALKISADRIGYNERLLALMLQTSNSRVLQFYAIGGILFVLVLITSVIMIYNTFNISVMDRVRQFGMLRCIGASRVQIKRLVRRESLIISLMAIPAGVLIGMLMTFIGSAVLKYYNPNLYGSISIFNISAVGIGAGVLIGFLSVFTASLLPARKAARASPVNAVTGSCDNKISQKTKHGRLTRLFRVETAIGVGNAFNKKRTLFLMSSSIALSVILFLAFNVLITPTFIGTNTTKAYTADISLTSDNVINPSLLKEIASLEGTKNVVGRMGDFVNATFDASRLTEKYKESVGKIQTENNNLIENPENSLLLSYDQTQLKWAKDHLAKGTCDESKLDKQNGVIAVRTIYRKDKQMETTNLKLGDKVYIRTNNKTEEFTVMGIIDSSPYSTNKLTMTTFITTETLFRKASGNTMYKDVDIQLTGKNQEQTVNKIKNMINDAITLHDKRQLNSEADNAFITIAIFLYGFVGVIALISILNIFNTMNTSIVSRTRYMGIMRAIGMSGKQLDKMVLTQSVTYSLTGCIAGCILGIILQKKLLNLLATEWTIPFCQVLLIVILCVAASILAVLSPLKKIKSKGISETIGLLQ